MLRKEWPPYTVPGLWVGSSTPVTFPSAPAYFLHQFQLVDADERRRRGRPWSLDRALMYNGMVRHITSYDHGPGVEESGWRTTGTFVKLAALLPHLVRMDVDTLILQPITEVGVAGKKGTLGSPYSVRHPWHLDARLGEEALSMSIEDQARVLFEMCHALGIRVVLELVLRTASLDSVLVPTNPEWFYWVDEGKVSELPDGLRPPHFSEEQIRLITEKVDRGDFGGLPEPDEEYQNLFAPPPIRVELTDAGWRGIGPKQRMLRVPGAFADWPPNDTQPPWTDVTYLRLHDHPHYRYMAYNTVRMFERGLDTEEYRSHPLWNTIASFIPYYVRTMNIDGAMIDMGHALPRDLRKRVMREARAAKPELLLFEENFNVTHQTADDGYDAAIGNLPLAAISYDEIVAHLHHVAKSPLPVRCFAAPESHNTMRAIQRWGSEEAVAAVWSILRVVPGCIGFIHAGMEVGERTPVNTGLGFTEEEAAQYPPETLPLFSDVPIHWNHDSAVLAAIIRTSRILHGSAFFEHASIHDHLIVLDTKKPLIAFLRIPPNSRQGLLCVSNLSDEPISQRIEIPADSGVMFLAPNACVKRASTNVAVELQAWQTELVFTLH